MTEVTYEQMEKAMDGMSQAYKGLDSMAAGYDALIKQGKIANKFIRSLPRTATRKTIDALEDIAGFVKPAIQASGDSLRKAGRYVKETALGTVKAGLETAQAYADSQAYKQMQDMYRNSSGHETEDRTSRIEAENAVEAETNPLKRTLGKAKNMFGNARAYLPFIELSGRLNEMGVPISPLQIYALNNGNQGLFMRLTAREKAEAPWLNLGRLSFATMQDFLNFYEGMAQQKMYAEYMQAAQEAYEARAGNNPNAQDRSERDITAEVTVESLFDEKTTRPKDIDLTRILPVKTYRGLLSPTNTKESSEANRLEQEITRLEEEYMGFAGLPTGLSREQYRKIARDYVQRIDALRESLANLEGGNIRYN
jgi:hypothetical protein